MNDTRAVRLPVIITRAVLIALSSSIAGLAFNMVSPGSIPYIYRTPHSVILSGGEARIIDAAEAYALFQKGDVVFIDARSVDQYRKGHIEGALSLPAFEADSHLDSIFSAVPPEKTVVAYCGGVECDESHRVADILMQCGYQNVMIFAAGFPAWHQAGFPVQTGDGKVT